MLLGHDKLPAEDTNPKIESNSIISGIGLGSLLYLSNALFGEVSLITRHCPTLGLSPGHGGEYFVVKKYRKKKDCH